MYATRDDLLKPGPLDYLLSRCIPAEVIVAVSFFLCHLSFLLCEMGIMIVLLSWVTGGRGEMRQKE